MCKLQLYELLLSWICITQAPTLVTLRSYSKVLYHSLLIFAVTRFYQHLIVDLVSIDACRVRRYKTSQISQELLISLSRVIFRVRRYKTSQISQELLISLSRVFKMQLEFSFYTQECWTETLKIFAGLSLFKNLQKFVFSNFRSTKLHHSIGRASQTVNPFSCILEF